MRKENIIATGLLPFQDYFTHTRRVSLTAHYKNMPMQYTEIFRAAKIEKFQSKNFDIF